MSSNSISIFLGAKFKTLLIHKLYWRSQHSMGQGPGGQKFVTLVQFYKLSMFPCFIVSDANYDSITHNSNSLLIWPLPRCNEDPDCRNPRGFRIAIYYVFNLKNLILETSRLNTKHRSVIPKFWILVKIYDINCSFDC